MALALAGAASSDYRSFVRGRRAALALLRSSGVADVEHDALVLVAREPDGEQARLAVAWALLSSVFDPTALSDRAPLNVERLDRRLALARELALEVYRARPAAYQAPLVVGGARYLRYRILGDERLYSDLATWEQPLRLAASIGRSAPEPRRLLAAAYLDVWFGLSDGKRDEVRGMLSDLFGRSIDEFDRLFPSWLAMAATRDEALALVPSTPEAWGRVKALFAARGDWRALAVAHERYRDVLDRFVDSRMAHAAAQLRSGFGALARDDYLDIVLRSEPERRLAARFVEALGRLPGGALSTGMAAGLVRWHDWALGLSLVGRNPLPAEVLVRIDGSAPRTSVARGAITALLAGDLPDAERRERDAPSTFGAEWAPYHVIKSERLLARGDLAGAERALDHVVGGWRERLPYVVARQRVARARGVTVEPAANGRARTWSARAWRAAGSSSLLEFEPDHAGGGLDVVLVAARVDGGVAELLLDGEVVRTVDCTRPVSVRLAVDVSAEPHLLEVRPVGGERVLPAEVALIVVDEGGAEAQP